jgi:hypothetical protein
MNGLQMEIQIQGGVARAEMTILEEFSKLLHCVFNTVVYQHQAEMSLGLGP